MKHRTLALATVATLFFAASIHSQDSAKFDLSNYRKLAFGAKLSQVAKDTGVDPASAKTICLKPAVVQDLEWQPLTAPHSTQTDMAAVSVVTLRFYQGELARTTVAYNRPATEGMTVEDMIEAISVSFGKSTKPFDEVEFAGVYPEKVMVLARWEDADYSFSLVQSSYPATFGLIGVSKRLSQLASVAVNQAKLDEARDSALELIERRKKGAAESLVESEKLRKQNKVGFRP